MAKLDAEERNALPDKDFAGPNRSYPIEDKGHAMAAKSEAAQHASPGMRQEIDEKVHNKYPGMGKDDPEHKELKRKLGMQEHEDIPHATMRDAMNGKHGPEIQGMAHSVHQRLRAANSQADEQRANDMDDVFHSSSPSKPNPVAAKTETNNRPPMAPSRDDRYDFGD